MNTINEQVRILVEKTFEEWGEGYGYNGDPDDAILDKTEELKKFMLDCMDKAFVAGRSKESWEDFKEEHDL